MKTVPERAPRERELPSVIPKPLRFELIRPRLLMRLEGAKLVALIAGSGFGKTTLLAQFARNLSAQAVWLELREDDSDTTSLARDLRSAIQRPRRDLNISHLETHEPHALARALDDAPENLTLILDRLDRVGPEAGRWFEAFVTALADGHRVIVAGYDADALSLARSVAEGSAVVIGPDELAFTPEETEQSLQERGYMGEANTVQTALEGWPAGVALVAAGASAQLAPTDLIADVLSKLPTDVRRSLPEAAVLEVWSEDAAARLGCRLPTGWIAAVRRAGLPLTPLGKGTYRPLQVLLETLEAELRRDAARHTALHRTAGIAAEATGDTLNAIRHYRTANLDDEAVRLAERVTPQLFAQAEYRLICRTLERLPLEQLSTDAREAFGIALTETEQVTRGEVILRQLRTRNGLSASGLFTLGKLALREGEHLRTLVLVDEGLRAAGEGTLDATRFLRLKGHALNELGRYTEALEVALEAIHIAESRDDLKELGQAILLAQYAHYMLGHWGACERLIRRGIEVFEALGQPIRALMLYNDLANLQCVMNRTDEARATLEYALPIAQREQNDVLRWLLETRADVHLWHGEFREAAIDYRAAASSGASFSRVETARFRLKLAEALWRDGQHKEAKATLSEASADIPANLERLRGRLAFVEGFVAFEEGQLKVAQDCFESAAQRSDDATQVPRAVALLAEIGRRTDQLGHAHIERLIERLDAVPSDAVLNTDNPHLNELWRVCITQGWFLERVASFTSLETDSIVLTTTRVTTVVAPVQKTLKLEIVTLGKLQVRMDGAVVRLPFAKAGEMLTWFALHGPSNHGQVIDALWDGSLESKHHEYFRVAVRRLRTALKGAGDAQDWNPLPFEDGVYTLSTHLQVETDTLLCERALETNDRAALEAALQAYRGEFLPGVDTEWVTQTRTRCLESAVVVALTLGAQLERTEPREALVAYRRAVELEPLGELGHLGLIRTHLTVGGKAAANQAYTAYARMLLEEFGLEPSADLRRSLSDLGLRV
jgi:LuxR family transcriptional regulator, maltose regulon positive regulatory protein